VGGPNRIRGLGRRIGAYRSHRNRSGIISCPRFEFAPSNLRFQIRVHISFCAVPQFLRDCIVLARCLSLLYAPAQAAFHLRLSSFSPLNREVVAFAQATPPAANAFAVLRAKQIRVLRKRFPRAKLNCGQLPLKWSVGVVLAEENNGRLEIQNHFSDKWK